MTPDDTVTVKDLRLYAQSAGLEGLPLSELLTLYRRELYESIARDLVDHLFGTEQTINIAVEP